MVVRKTKKVRKQRGSRTYGWGMMHRGKGQKGGSGNAGGGKKCQSKKQKFPAGHLGKSGFKKKGIVLGRNGIHIRDIEEKLISWNLKEENGVFIVDLKKRGYDKLLSQGHLTQKLKIIVGSASKKAQEKVKASGGEIAAS